MRYLVLDTEAEALAAEASIWQAMEPNIVELRDGVPVNPRITQRWAVPRALIDGRWVVAAFGNDGQEWSADWALFETEEVYA